MMLDNWMYGLIGMFLTIVIFFSLTPAINGVMAATNLFNFGHVATNTSLTTLKTRVDYMWNAWPIVAGAMVFIVIFIMTSESSKYEGGG